MKEFAYIHEHGRVPSALRTLPFLGSFDDEQLDDVLDSSNYVECEPGDVMIDEGAIDSRIYILLKGEVEVRRDGKLLATIGRSGEVFGELAVVNEDRRSASVVAKTQVVCLAVDQKFLQDIKPREEYPAFYAALYEFIARLTAGRLEATSRKLAQVQNELRLLKEKLTAKRAPARPAKRLKSAATKRKAPARRGR